VNLFRLKAIFLLQDGFAGLNLLSWLLVFDGTFSPDFANFSNGIL